MSNIQKLIDDHLDKLGSMTPGTPEYTEAAKALEALEGARDKELLAGIRANQAEADRNIKRMEIEQKAEEAKLNYKANKRRNFWGFMGSLVGGALSLIGIPIGVHMLREVKEDQGVVDKDEMSIVRGVFPRL